MEDGRIVFCAPHTASQSLLAALIHARNVLTECEFNKPGEEKAKKGDGAAHIDEVINRTRR